MPPRPRRHRLTDVHEAPFAPDETGRLMALEDLHLLDTPQERRFDRVAQLAARLTRSPIGLMTLVAETRVFFKSACGASAAGVVLGEPHRSHWFCSHVVATGAPLVVTDARADERFNRLAVVDAVPPVLAYAGVPVRAPGGEHVGALAVMSLEPREYSDAEIGALVEMARLLEAELSSIPHMALDALTGALNARTFIRLGNRLLELADSRGEPVSLLRLDIRGTSEINSRLGYENGDRALSETAHLLGSTVRGSDLVGRIGPDEFAVLLLDAGEDEARAVADRLTAATAERNAAPDHRFELAFDIAVVGHRPSDRADLDGELLAAALTA